MCLRLCPEGCFFGYYFLFVCLFVFKERQKRKEDGRETESSAQELWSVRSWGFFQWDCFEVPGDSARSPAIWEEHGPVNTLRVRLSTQIPFAPFHFGFPCLWRSPAFCLSILSKLWGWRQRSHHLPPCLTQRRRAIRSQRLWSVCNVFRRWEIRMKNSSWF